MRRQLCEQAFEVTLLFFYLLYSPEHEDEGDALKVALAAGIHLRVWLCPHIHVHMSPVLNNASALRS